MGNPFRVCGRAGKSREEEEERLYTNKRMDEMIRGSGKKKRPNWRSSFDTYTRA